MPFTGTPVVKEITDGLVRISGISVDGGESGSIALHGTTLPGVDIVLPETFRPREYIYADRTAVSLIDSVQVSFARRLPGTVQAPIAINKSGLSPSTFNIVIANTSTGQGILGRAQGFAVAGGQQITNAGATTITGDLSVFPGGPPTGFPPGTVTGTQHIDDPEAFECFTDVSAAYASLVALNFTTDLTGQPLGGLTLTPGVYRFNGPAALTGNLTLDAQGDTNASFVFQIQTTLTLTAVAAVQLLNSASAGNVFWTVGTDAVLGAGLSVLNGTILALNSITMGAGAIITEGRALIASIQGVVDLDTNTITLPTSTQPSTSGELEIYIRFH